MLLKQPPFSNEAEQSVLGSIFMQNDVYWTVSGIVKADDFYRPDHKTIYEAICVLSEQDNPCDIVTVSEYLSSHNNLVKIGGMVYLGTITKDSPSAANAKNYADIVAKHARARRAIQVMSESIDELMNAKNPDETISTTQASLETTATSLAGETLFMDVLSKGVDMITSNRERRLLGALPGVSYTLPSLDERTGGLRKAQLIAIAGRPSLGKTAYAHQIVMHAAMKGIPVGEISLEMSQEQLAVRSFANRFRVNGTALMFGHDAPIQTVTDGLSEDPGFRNIPLHVDTNTYDYHAITSRVVEWKRKYDIQAVVIDHIGLISMDKHDKKVDRLGFITNNLKRLAKRLDIPIIIVVQLNRSLEKDKRRPILSDFRDCGEIEQDIDVGIFIHSEGDDEAQEVNIELGLLKNRDGMRGWLPSSINIKFRKHIQTFEQL